MFDILHRVGVEGATTDQVYTALTTLDGLTSWWTRDTTGDPDVGGIIAFRFPPGGFDMEVVEQQPGEHVVWKVVDGPPEWVDTTIDWQLRQDDDLAVILFKHQGWSKPVEFMHHCSTKWATYLMSLKASIESGAGAPAPDDVHIAWPD